MRPRACLALAGVVACGPLGFLPEGIGEGVGVGGRGAGQAAAGGLDAEVAGEVVLAVPGGGAKLTPLARIPEIVAVRTCCGSASVCTEWTACLIVCALSSDPMTAMPSAAPT